MCFAIIISYLREHEITMATSSSAGQQYLVLLEETLLKWLDIGNTRGQSFPLWAGIATSLETTSLLGKSSEKLV